MSDNRPCNCEQSLALMQAIRDVNQWYERQTKHRFPRPRQIEDAIRLVEEYERQTTLTTIENQ